MAAVTTTNQEEELGSANSGKLRVAPSFTPSEEYALGEILAFMSIFITFFSFL